MAFAGRDMKTLCLHNSAALDAGALADVRATHPLLSQAGSTGRSPDYAPDDAWARYNQPLPGDAMAVIYPVRKLGELSAARSFAAQYASRLGMSLDGIADLQLIATELAANSLDHAGGACRLAFWQHNGHIVCEARDRGRLDDPLAGRLPPPTNSITGRGLFLINTIADLVRTHTSPDGTTIQAYLPLDPWRGGTT